MENDKEKSGGGLINFAKKLTSTVVDVSRGNINPEKIISLAGQVANAAKAFQRHFIEKNENLIKMENEVEAARKKGDDLEASVKANWAGIKKCESSRDYLAEEMRIAEEFEQHMKSKNKNKQLGE